MSGFIPITLPLHSSNCSFYLSLTLICLTLILKLELFQCPQSGMWKDILVSLY